jgi:hypothetical protein
MGRGILVAFVLCGCDQLFELPHITERDGGGADDDGDSALAQDASAAKCESIELSDNFDDGQIAQALWYAWATDPAASATEIDHQLRLDLGTGNVDDRRQAELVSLAAYDFTGREAIVELTGISNPSAKLQATLIVRNEDSTEGFALLVEQNRVYCGMRTPMEYVPLVDVEYVPQQHRFFAIRESAGMVHYSASPDGVQWSDVFSIAPQFSVTALRVGVYVYMDGAGIDPGYATFDNFTLCKPAS